MRRTFLGFRIVTGPYYFGSAVCPSVTMKVRQLKFSQMMFPVAAITTNTLKSDSR